MGGKKRLLLHICCGPCAITVTQGLLRQGFDVTGLYYNPNIHPLTEYLKRREALVEASARLGVKVIYKDGDYNPSVYLQRTAFREPNRCFHCYHLRLKRAHSIAKRGGFDCFSTTLLYSKMQKHEQIRDLGRDLAAGSKTAFHYQDFRDTWKDGILLSKEWGLYRQQYCGCIYSEYERYKNRLEE